MVDQAETVLQEEDELDLAFENTLRPLMSSSARQIFVTMVKSPETQLTTLDIQDNLKTYRLKLSKKELNNWLSSLQASGLVQKELERGKPTTIPYSDRYTYDLWSLTEKGRETAHKLSIFTHETPTLNNVKTIVKTGLPSLETITTGQISDLEKLYMSITTLRVLRVQEEPIDSLALSVETGVRHEKTIEWIKSHADISSKNLYHIERKVPGFLDRMLGSLGFKEKEVYHVSLSPEGKRIAEALP